MSINVNILPRSRLEFFDAALTTPQLSLQFLIYGFIDLDISFDSLNVVLVSLPDKFLDETTASLKANFPKQKFISVAAKFDHKTDYMPAIIEVC